MSRFLYNVFQLSISPSYYKEKDKLFQCAYIPRDYTKFLIELPANVFNSNFFNIPLESQLKKEFTIPFGRLELQDDIIQRL